MVRPTDRRIDKLIHLLVTNGTVVVPGPKIASEIGVTRAVVWSWIEKLRALGVEIKGHPASGYQLRKLPDVLVPSLIRPELGDIEIGRRIIHYFKLDSTNDLAMAMVAGERAGKANSDHGTTIVAEEQTRGRGRFGRSWYSEKSSGIYVSVILRPLLAPAAAPALTLAAGVAAHAALRSSAGVAIDIRWPNDVLANGKKVCGILTEMSAEVDRLHAVVIGVGINVNHGEMPPELRGIATSLRIETGKVHSRAQVLIALLKELDRYYRLLLEEGSAGIARRWAAASTYAEGKRIRVVTGAGGFTATTLGLDPSGALRVRRDDGVEEALVSGEVMEVK